MVEKKEEKHKKPQNNNNNKKPVWRVQHSRAEYEMNTMISLRPNGDYFKKTYYSWK